MKSWIEGLKGSSMMSGCGISLNLLMSSSLRDGEWGCVELLVLRVFDNLCYKDGFLNHQSPIVLEIEIIP